MNILSLFDGLSGAQIALERSGIKVNKYFASEVDKYAIAVTQHNYPDTIQLGDIKNIKVEDLPEIDLLIGGSPCQGFSFAGKQLNFEDERSKLFFEYVGLLKECKPKYFLLENVKMKKEYQNIISELLGVEPILICSSLVSAQNRKRLYWTNIEGVGQPKDKKILLQDILDNSQALPQHSKKALRYMNNMVKARSRWNIGVVHSLENKKSQCITANMFKGVPNNVLVDKKPAYGKTKTDFKVFRKLAVVECERLQTLPDNYTLAPFGKKTVSNSQRYKMIGNGFTVDVIAHILSDIKLD